MWISAVAIIHILFISRKRKGRKKEKKYRFVEKYTHSTEKIRFLWIKNRAVMHFA